MLYHAESQWQVSIIVMSGPCLFTPFVLSQAVDEFILGLGVKEANANN